MNIALEPDATPEDRKVLTDGLNEYNKTHAAPDDYEALNIFVRDNEGRIIGGLTGETFWRWLHIGILWLDEGIRKQNIGEKLVRMAEEEAIGRGCFGAFVNTISFQAPDFYIKQGYEQWGEIADQPPGHRRIFFQKRLVGPGDE